ncbi:MAG: IS630 family transposase [Chthoniobacterales bacterium]
MLLLTFKGLKLGVAKLPEVFDRFQFSPHPILISPFLSIHTNFLDEPKKIRNHLIEKTPDQLKLSFALWTREAVGLLIEEVTGKKLDLRQVGRYLKRWGFTPQRPIKRAYQRDDKKVQTWLKEEYPAIKKQAAKENAEIHWADETGLNSHDHRGCGYAPKGKTPVREHNARYEKINMISSVTNQGKLCFMCYEGSFTYQTFHTFLKGLIHEAAGRKIVVIIDNLRVHHSKVIKRWLRRYANLIQVRYLPSYSPYLNPDEYLNCNLKTELAKRPERRDKGKWRATVEDVASKLSNNPARVKKYFDAESIAYAA